VGVGGKREPGVHAGDYQGMHWCITEWPGWGLVQLIGTTLTGSERVTQQNAAEVRRFADALRAECDRVEAGRLPETDQD
jgi:hypothetical protein